MKARRIMLVDDDRNVLESLARVLRRDDYEFLKFEDARSAWKFLRDCDGNVDIIISDNKMPHAQGTDLLIEMRRMYPNVIRIMLTGQSSVEDARKATLAGKVYRFLTKPCDPDELRLIITHALAHKDLWDENRRLKEQIAKKAISEGASPEHSQAVHDVKRDDDGRVVIDEDDSSSLDDFMKKYQP